MRNNILNSNIVKHNRTKKKLILASTSVFSLGLFLGVILNKNLDKLKIDQRIIDNYDSIQKAKQVTVVEAEKSVLKRDSLNDSTLVALSGHTMSEEQAAILIGLNVDIVIALDKDVPIEEVWDICEKFYNKRNVYYIQDKWDLLKEKDSPADAKNKIYNFLMKYKVKYDAEHHRKYLKSLQK